MRKSLLMTSALGLMMPALAMASSVAGSSAAACGSGFFAQFDAKIMNAKLEIKNEKGDKSTVPADEETDADKIKNNAAADVFAQIKKAEAEALFNYGTEDGKEAFFKNLLATAKIKELRANVAKEVGTALGVPAVGTDDEKVAALLLVGRRLIADPEGDIDAVKAGAKIFDNIVADVTKLLNVIDPTIKTGTLGSALANSFLVETRGPRLIADALADSMVNSEKLKRSFYSKNLGNKVYILNTGATLDEPGLSNYLKDFKAKLNDNLDNTENLDVLKTSPVIVQYAKTTAADNTKLNASYAITKKLEIFDRRVHHHALAGGVGATVGWWQNLGGFALSISGSGDYLWGTFRIADDKTGETDAKFKRRLGFGFQGDVGVHYVVSPSTTLGVLVGLRGQQLNIGRTDKTQPTNKDSKGDYASKWMINPVVTMQARTFFTDTVYGALSVGYIIPIEKDYKLENTNITNKDAKIRFQGLTGAFSVGMVF